MIPIQEMGKEIEITVIANTGTDSLNLERVEIPKLTIDSPPETQGPTLTWVSQEGHHYTVERSFNLATWEVVANIEAFLGQTSKFNDRNVSIKDRKGVYYRVRRSK